MSTNQKATFSKRAREMAQKDRVQERALRRDERKARAAERAATGQVGPEIGEPILPDDDGMVAGGDASGEGGDAPRIDRSAMTVAPRPPRERLTAKRLYVGNLSFDTDADGVREIFAAIGEVTAVHVVMDRDTGRPRGFAFVTMALGTDAQRAISELNGAMVDGRPLRVNEAEERTGGGGGHRGGGGGRGRY